MEETTTLCLSLAYILCLHPTFLDTGTPYSKRFKYDKLSPKNSGQLVTALMHDGSRNFVN